VPLVPVVLVAWSLDQQVLQVLHLQSQVQLGRAEPAARSVDQQEPLVQLGILVRQAPAARSVDQLVQLAHRV
jgi:hypothetical protein